MKQINRIKWTAVFAAVIFVTSCNDTAADNVSDSKSDSSEALATTPNHAALKAEIQNLETAWGNADNARDVNALAAYYSDDAVSMSDNMPMLVGNAAIRKDLEESMAKRPKGSTTAYEVMDVYGGGNYVTETGKMTRKDATGNTISTGKYMAVWEKRDGKWICIRDISNSDTKDE